MQTFVPNQGDAWRHFVDLAKHYFERVLLGDQAGKLPPEGPGNFLRAVGPPLPPPSDDVISGVTLEMSALLGRRTAELHQALSGGKGEAFRPEDFSILYQRSLYQAMQNQAKQELRLLQKGASSLSPLLQAEVQKVLDLQPEILAGMHAITAGKLTAKRIRIHGDYHLGQVLFTGNDFVMLDFEGEPARPLSERRIKRSPMRDVAGMLRSFQYAAYTALLSGSALRPQVTETLTPWADRWYQVISVSFLRGYLGAMEGSDLLPHRPEELENLLVPFLLQKAVYELGYERNNRPEWLIIPLRGIQLLCGE
jgi:maltose alpha-D-glucosyltransferase/alpha-amylase